MIHAVCMYMCVTTFDRVTGEAFSIILWVKWGLVEEGLASALEAGLGIEWPADKENGITSKGWSQDFLSFMAHSKEFVFILSTMG